MPDTEYQVGSNQSAVHSATLPAMSSAPYSDAPRGLLPTAAVVPVSQPVFLASLWPTASAHDIGAPVTHIRAAAAHLPSGYRLHPPRATFSHCASVGSLPPFQAQ